jgi:hypothetical protein
MQTTPGKEKLTSLVVLACCISLALLLAGMLPASKSHAVQTVAGGVGQPTGAVAATPISIPRPIQLEKMQRIPAVKAAPAPGSAISLAPQHEALENAEIVRIQGNEVTLRLHYRVSPDRSRPIYAGAWLYDADQQAIDAGYKPVALRAFPEGSVEVTLVLPQTGFRSDYLVAFLMESGQPVFVNGRFNLPYTWQNGLFSRSSEVPLPQASVSATPALQSKPQFCTEYAKTALAQYNFAVANNLPGITPPVWSNDSANHYNWCLGVSQETANQGTALRQGHIDKYRNVQQKSSQEKSRVNKAKGSGSVAATPISIPRPIQAKPGFSPKGPLPADEDPEEPVQQLPMHQTPSPEQQIQLNPVGGAATGPKVAPIHPGKKKGFDPGRGP